ncbi:phage tail tape measure protein [Iodobacter fluviatilis]|uniref:Minor tail protein n=1 Tax=Iodobacter fluviatilis TaxID=537 RepID=A0A377QCX0_9NEIS|nr:phage tail tape measure protein [Iodobacter fluviatilis]TCU81205.1 minor tail protein [Iodobacter fluviatilis]STQ91721.1 Phage-related minor tail protein [Iodobacter fluviatilis]
MSRDLAIGIVIGGAVSSTFGSAINKTQRSVEGLQGKLANTKGLQSLVGETQRLQRSMEQADRASRRIGLDGVRTLRSEVTGLEKDWKGATDRVGGMAKQLATMRKSTAGKADVSALEAEHTALSRSLKLTQSAAEAKKNAWLHARKDKTGPSGEVLALKAEYQAALLAAKGQKALLAEKRAQIAASKEATAAESKLSRELEKTQQEAKRAKQAFEAKRAALHATKNELKQQTQALGGARQASTALGSSMRDVATSQRAVADGGLRRRLDTHIGQLRQAGIAVDKLDREYIRLGRTSRGLALQEAGKTQMDSGMKLGRTAGLGLATAAIPTKISGDYQAEIRDIAIKAGIAGQGGEKELDGAIRAAAKRQKMAQSDLAASVNGLVTQGMDWREAVGYSDLLGKLTIGQKMESGDAAQLIYSLQQNGVNQAEMEKVMGQIAVAGDIGAFESDKMAKFMPELLATVGSMGMQGPEAVRYIAASLQAQIKLTGNADSAANNFKNLLSKIIAPDSNKKFADAGIDLQGSMEATMRAHGDGPVAAFMRLTENLATSGDATRAKKLADIKARIKNASGDKKAEEEALSAYMQAAGLGEVLSDMQARSAALAQIKYGQQIKDDLIKIQNTDGIKKLDTDKSKRDETSNRKWDVVASEFTAAMVTIGDAIRPVTDFVADTAAQVLKFGTTITANNPAIALTALAAGIGVGLVALKRVAAGAGTWLVGKSLEKMGLRLPGASSEGSAAGGAGPAEAGVQQVFVTNWPTGPLGGSSRRPSVGGTASPASHETPQAEGPVRPGKRAKIGRAFKAGGRLVSRFGGSVMALGSLGASAYGNYKNGEHVPEFALPAGEQKAQASDPPDGIKIGATLGEMIAPGIGSAVGGFLDDAVGVLRDGQGEEGGQGADAGGVQEVFVTNLPAGGGLDLSGEGADRSGGGRERSSRRRGRGAGRVRPALGPLPAVERVGKFAKIGQAFKVGGKVLGKVGGAALSVASAGFTAYDTYKNAKTAPEKGKGYGGAAGSLGGGLAGAKMGAVIGTMIAPGIGTAIGGLLGGAIGALGGEKIGALIGKAIAGKEEAKPPAPAAPAPPAAPPVVVPPAVKPEPKIIPSQVFTFQPTIQVTVKGDVKNPQQIATEIAPHLKRIFDGWQQQASRSAMYDPIG